VPDWQGDKLRNDAAVQFAVIQVENRAAAGDYKMQQRLFWPHSRIQDPGITGTMEMVIR
jgi:hypothetical protein